MKPRYGAGSRSVFMISSPSEWQRYFAEGMPYDEDYVLEEAIAGQEYGIDGIVIDGTFHLILARKKLITPPPYRQCIGYISTNNKNYSHLQEIIKSFVSELVRAINLKDGILHADIIYDGNAPFVIEMSARPSGHRLHDIFTPLVTGVDMISEFLKYAAGERIHITPSEREEVFIIRYFDFEEAVMHIPDEMDLRARYPIIKYECNLKLGETAKITDGHSLMGRGYFILKADSEEEACNTANDILSEFIS